jgi:hypothetical protein
VIRTAIVLAFLLGMPLVAVPQFSEQLHGLLLAQHETRLANPPRSIPDPSQPVGEVTSAQRGTTITTLAADHAPHSLIGLSADGLVATIEGLKAEFVAAGVTYMALERVETGSPHYRFRFDMPVAAGSAYRRRFQVVDDAPDEAMRKALAELRQWRVAGHEPAHLERPTVILR